MPEPVDPLQELLMRFRRQRWFLHLSVLITISGTVFALANQTRTLLALPAPHYGFSIGTICVIALAFSAYLCLSRHDPIPLRGRTHDEVRENLNLFDEQSLDAIAGRFGIPFPDEMSLVQKRNALAKGIPLQYLLKRVTPSPLPFVIGPLFVILIILSLSVRNMSYEPEPVTHVRRFYDAINRGIAGDNAAWATMWDYFPTEKQRGYYMKKWPQLDFPDDLDELYKGSSFHSVLYAKQMESSEHQDIVDVVYQVEEHHPENRFGLYTTFPESPKLSSFFQRYPDAASVAEAVAEDLRDSYVVPNDKLSEIEPYVTESKLATIMSPRYLAEIAATLQLTEKDRPPGPEYHNSRYKHVLTLEARRITLEKQDGKSVIANNAIQGRYSYPFTPIRP